MHDCMVACHELDKDDVYVYRSGGSTIIAPPTAVAEPAPPVAEPHEVVTPNEETLVAMRWATKISDDSNVLSLIRSLPKPIVDEQVTLYNKREETAVAAAETAVAEQLPKVKLRSFAKVPCREKIGCPPLPPLLPTDWHNSGQENPLWNNGDIHQR